MSRHLPQRCIFMMPFCFAVSIALVEALIVPAFMAKVWTSSGFQIPNCVSFHVSRPSIHSKIIKQMHLSHVLSEDPKQHTPCRTVRLWDTVRAKIWLRLQSHNGTLRKWCGYCFGGICSFLLISFNWARLLYCVHIVYVYLFVRKSKYHISTLHSTQHSRLQLTFPNSSMSSQILRTRASWLLALPLGWAHGRFWLGRYKTLWKTQKSSTQKERREYNQFGNGPQTAVSTQRSHRAPHLGSYTVNHFLVAENCCIVTRTLFP